MRGDVANFMGKGDDIGTVDDGGVNNYQDVRIIVADGPSGLVDGDAGFESYIGGEPDGEYEEGGIGVGDAGSSGGGVDPMDFGVERGRRCRNCRWHQPAHCPFHRRLSLVHLQPYPFFMIPFL